MPQMGESIAEGTVSKWLKQIGEAVERDEPILEISTDKVDAEIPAPQGGTLVEIAVQEGETVEVGTVVAYIDTDGAAPGAKPSGDGVGQETASSERAEERGPEQSDEKREESAPEAPATEPQPTEPASAPSAGASTDSEDSEERLRTRSTPVVRRIAEEHGIDIGSMPGSGHAGRVTKQDILSFIEGGAPEEAAAGQAAPAEAAAPQRTAPAPERPTAPGRAADATPSDFWSTFYREVQHPESPVRPADRVEPMDKIRRLTAEHMVLAKRVAPHVHTITEIDFSHIDQIRAESKARWESQGVKVSYTAFVGWAVSRVLRDFPTVNSTISGNNVIYRGNVNVGIAVDLDPGLIVPVVHDADHLGLVGIGNKLADLATRARDRKLSPSDIQGATFSITNPGVLGTLVGMPIIPKGTSAILLTGAIEKRVVVVTDPKTGTDSTAIRKRAFFCLGYDHRIVDGADAARFLARLKETLESFPGDA
ncbi:MAG TPA: dihydrolipoamide acetyltransferase family protein [Candidatus Limnocylindrales bacterium]|nr:dihydrolipoamide acetyltransferase family protein [Candidatus Limnocylindrales bacterium]